MSGRPFVWKETGILLDGHNRFAICKKHGIPFKTIAKSFADRTAAEVWMLENQLARRNVTPFQRAELVLKLKPLQAARRAKR